MKGCPTASACSAGGAVRGAAAIGRYLSRAASALPYGHGSGIRHVLGNELGGGYEWTNAHHDASRGITALELDGDGRVSDLVAVWDGAMLDAVDLAALTGLVLEH